MRCWRQRAYASAPWRMPSVCRPSVPSPISPAAALHGLPLPRRLEAAACEGALHVMAPTGDGRVERDGCIGHRGLQRRHTEFVDGVRVTSLAETWCDFGELRRGTLTIADLVTLGDAAVARCAACGLGGNAR